MLYGWMGELPGASSRIEYMDEQPLGCVLVWTKIKTLTRFRLSVGVFFLFSKMAKSSTG